MPASVSQLRGWNPTVLAGVAEDIARVNSMFDVRVHHSQRAIDDALVHWEGDAAAAAQARALAEHLSGSELATAVDAYSDAFGIAARELDAVRTSALTVVDSAVARGFEVLDDGSVVAPTSATGDGVVDLLLQSDFEQKAREIEDQLTPLLVAAADTDESCAERLRKAVETVLGLQRDPGAAPQPDSPQVRAIVDGHSALPDDPAALADFWGELTQADKDGLAAWDPTIGNRDGLPAVDKSRYNALLLTTLTSDARDLLGAVEARHPDWMEDRNLPLESRSYSGEDADQLREYSRWLDDRDAAEEMVVGYQTVQTQLAREGAPTFLLNIDDKGRGALALNNPDVAANVATYVPGTSTVLASIGRDMTRAENLLDTANMVSRGPNSVITWLGYTAPPDLHDATSERFADAGAVRLDRFQDGLRAAHEGMPAHNTVIGHSYGNTVIGHAMRDGAALDVDDVVFVGSHGAGVQRADELTFYGLDPSENAPHVYATAGPGDWTADIAPDVHGSNPAAPYFGATTFGTGDTGPSSHDNYFDRGNQALDAMGAIIVGRGTAGMGSGGMGSGGRGSDGRDIVDWGGSE